MTAQRKPLKDMPAPRAPPANIDAEKKVKPSITTSMDMKPRRLSWFTEPCSKSPLFLTFEDIIDVP